MFEVVFNVKVNKKGFQDILLKRNKKDNINHSEHKKRPVGKSKYQILLDI